MQFTAVEGTDGRDFGVRSVSREDFCSSHGSRAKREGVKQHLEYIFSKRNSSNQMAVSMVLGLHPWITNAKDNQYLAAKRAIKTVFGTEADMIWDGSTIPIAKIFQDVIRKSVLMVPWMTGRALGRRKSGGEQIPVGADPSLRKPRSPRRRPPSELPTSD
ncbi:hypothetical protein MC885_004968 [Smutsia gigantea]|nr:hypothetical protein MC885_004968 [Smutsia gigantea]